MKKKGLERRICERFKISGVSVSIKNRKLLSPEKEYNENRHPVVEFSRGGIRFLAQRSIKPNNNISLRIFFSEDDFTLNIEGKVRWRSLNPEISYRYQVGVQFNPYGMEKGNNHPEILERIIELEHKYLTN